MTAACSTRRRVVYHALLTIEHSCNCLKNRRSTWPTRFSSLGIPRWLASRSPSAPAGFLIISPTAQWNKLKLSRLLIENKEPVRSCYRWRAFRKFTFHSNWKNISVMVKLCQRRRVIVARFRRLRQVIRARPLLLPTTMSM